MNHITYLALYENYHKVTADKALDLLKIKDYCFMEKYFSNGHPFIHDFEIYNITGSNLTEDTIHHHEFYEISIILNGTGSYNIAGATYTFKTGDILLVAPFQLHKFHITSTLENYQRFVIWVKKTFFEKYKTSLTDLQNCFSVAQIRPKPFQRDNIAQLLHKTQKNYVDISYGSDLLANSFLVLALVEINKLVASQNENQILSQTSATCIVNKTMSYINLNFSQNISLDLLAKELFVSKSYLSHEFQRIVDISVYKYVTKKRLTIAKQLLLDGLTPTEVYPLCGFKDYANFYRAYKLAYNVSPKDFSQKLSLNKTQKKGNAHD